MCADNGVDIILKTARAGGQECPNQSKHKIERPGGTPARGCSREIPTPNGDQQGQESQHKMEKEEEEEGRVWRKDRKRSGADFAVPQKGKRLLMCCFCLCFIVLWLREENTRDTLHSLLKAARIPLGEARAQLSSY